MDLRTEKEYCHCCKKDTLFEVYYKGPTKSPKRYSGICLDCGLRTKLQETQNPMAQTLYFGKFRGKALKDIPIDYLQQTLRKHTVNNIMKGKIKQVLAIRIKPQP